MADIVKQQSQSVSETMKTTYKDMGDGTHALVISTGGVTSNVAITSPTDATTGALEIVDYAHHEIHSGSHFYIEATASIANGANLDFLWVVPNTTKWPHALWELEAEKEITMSLYEAVSTSASGSAVAIVNNNRNSTKTPGVTAFTGPTLTSGALGDEGNGGTLIWSATVGSGRKIGGESGRGHELVAKQNTKYWFRITNASGDASWINYDFNWYEHTNSG